MEENKMKKYLAVLLTMALLLSVAGTAMAATVDGTATPNDSTGVVTISGTVTGGVSGQHVTVLVVEDGTNIASLTASAVVYMAQTTSDGSGNYSVSFVMPEGKRTGTYDVYIGGTEVGTPRGTELTYPTEEPTATPTPAAPVVDMATAKPAVNNSNAFYYFITITLNDGMATAFNVKHYPVGVDEANAATQDFGLTNISDATIKVISVLKDIPYGQENREITSKATLTYTIGGNSGTAEDTKTTTLNTTKGD